MSFGFDLYSAFQNLTNGIFDHEVVLIYKLQDSFLNIKNYYPNYSAAIDIIHGSKGQVKFTYNGSAISSISTGTVMQRELADMLFIVFSSKKSEIRLMYLQNKKGKREDYFKADLLQLYLLHERCEIISSPLPDCTFNNSKILKDAVLPSVGSYGVFYQKQKTVDMAYYPANLVFPCSPIGRSVSRYVNYNSCNFSKNQSINNFIESQGEINLENFGNSLIDMKIGTPINNKNDYFRDVVSFLKNNSTVFSEAEMAKRFENYSDNSKDKKIFDGVSTVLIFDADKIV